MAKRQINILIAALTTSVATYYGQPYYDKFKMYQSIYIENQKPLFCNSELHKLLYNVGESLDIPYKKLNSIKFYHTSQPYPVYFGSLDSNSTPSIGVPVSFQYNEFEDMDDFNKKPPYIKWDEGYGLQLKKALLLNEDEKKFALGQVLYLLDGINLPRINHFTNIGITFGWLSAYVYGFSKVKPRSFNIYMGSMFATLIALLLIKSQIMSVIKHKMEFEGDFISSFLSWRANHAGLTYLKKYISRNQAIAEIENEIVCNNYANYTKDGCETFQMYTVYDRLFELENDRNDRPPPDKYFAKLQSQKSQKEQQLLEATEKIKLPFE